MRNADSPSRTFAMLLLSLLPALLARSAMGQTSWCAGQPCPETAPSSLPPVLARPPSAKAEERPALRAVLVDAIVMTPPLEKANARLGIEQEIMAALRHEGWDLASVTASCKDFGCAGEAAKAANAPYAVVLTGRFAKQESYVADIGVSLMRDGSVVASRNELDEENAARQEGRSAFTSCGPPAGICTTALLTTKLRRYATALVRLENGAIRERRAIAPAPVVPAPIAAQRPPTIVQAPGTPSTVPSAPQAPSRALGWSLVVGGGALVATGVVLWALNGTTGHCTAVAGDPDACRQQLRTRPAAIASGVAGLAAAGAGIVVLRWNRDSAAVTLSVQGNGISVGGAF